MAENVASKVSLETAIEESQKIFLKGQRKNSRMLKTGLISDLELNY